MRNLTLIDKSQNSTLLWFFGFLTENLIIRTQNEFQIFEFQNPYFNDVSIFKDIKLNLCFELKLKWCPNQKSALAFMKW